MKNTCFNQSWCQIPLFSHIKNAHYILRMMIILKWGIEQNDNAHINMAMICLIDAVCEVLQLIPSWHRRQFLIIDEVLRILLRESELWHIDMY